MKKTLPYITLSLLACLSLSGCVERLIKITTRPAGALVWLNDEEVGATPLEVPFTWYGQYEVVIRKDGYQTLKTAQHTPVPFYQWPGLDLFAETLPVPLTDRHEWDFTLTPQSKPDRNTLIERAQALRREVETE